MGGIRDLQKVALKGATFCGFCNAEFDDKIEDLVV